MATPSPARRPLLRVAGVLVLGLATLAGLATAADALWASGDEAGVWARLRWEPGALAVLLWWLASLLAGPRLVGLLPPDDRARAPSGWRLGSWMIGVHGLNLALPGPAGDLAFMGALVKGHGLSARGVVAATTFSRVGGLATIALLGLALLPFAPHDSLLARALLAALALLAAGGLLLGAGALRPDLLRRLSAGTVGTLARRLSGPPAALLAKVDAGVSGLADGLAGVAQGGAPALARTIAWSLAIQAALAGSLGCAALAVGAPLPAAGLPLTHVTAELASVAVAVAPAGLGGFDGALAAALVAFCGQEGADAARVVLCIRAVQLVALGGGTLALAGVAPGLLRRAGSAPA